MTAFSESYERLNAAQKDAVDSIDGPVMVVAGPGTGKTQVIAMRVANILRKTQMNPSNILCLTYSTSGTKAMRERLRTIIGPAAYGVTVSTIHGFCNDLIQRNPDVFEDFRALEQVSSIEQLRVIRRAFVDLGPSSILGKSFAGKDRASDVLRAISDMKRDGIDPARLKDLIPLYENEIKFTAKGKERDTSTQAYKSDERRVKQFCEFISVYEAYMSELKSSHRYDYDDMVLVALKGLSENEWLLSSLQERYQYVLTDEFQDLNGAQNAIIHKIIDYLYSQDAPNIFVVGDDDQAIYRFQGASIANMKSFLDRFSDAKIVTLTENYRSNQAILDSAAKVIDYNDERLSKTVPGIDKTLRAAIGGKGNKPVTVRYPDETIEYAAIAKKLVASHENGVDWSNMAVICRRNQEVLEISDVLTAAHVPCEVVAKRDLMTHAKALETTVFLRAILNPEVSDILSAAFSLPSFGCHPAQLGLLWSLHRQYNRSCDFDDALSLSDYMLRHRDKIPERILKAHDVILGLHQKLPAITLPELVQEALIVSGLLPDKETTSADPRDIAGIHAFYDYVKNRCYEQKSVDLRSLLADLDQYLNEPSLKLEYDMPHLVTDGVQLMTAHGAKGLEFDTVIIANAWHGNWGNRKGGSGLALPNKLIYDIDDSVEKNAQQEDERRLFYVAMTRAKRELMISFPDMRRSGESMRDNQLSVFVAEADDSLQELIPPPADLPDPIETLSRTDLEIDDAFRSFLQKRIEEFELSVTALNSFLEDPQDFLWDHLLMRPRAKGAQLAFGSAVHHALEERSRAWMKGEEFSEAQLIESFESYLGQREVMTEDERIRHLELGATVLKRYAKQTQDKPIILMAERKLSARLGDIPLTGKVDRIDLFEMNGRRCNVIDYKTGNPKKTEDAVRKDGNYFRQLVFYKILCDNDPAFIHEAEKFTFDFLGNEKEERKLIEIHISEAETDELKEVIQKVWQKIIAMDFSPL